MVSNQKWLSIAEHKQYCPLNLCEPSFTGANERALCLQQQMTDARLKISLLAEPLSCEHPPSDQIKTYKERQMQPNEVPTFKASIEKWRDHSVSKRSHVQHCALRRDDLKRVGPAWVNHHGLCSGRKLGWEKKISAESNIQLKHVGQRPVTVQAWMRRSTVNH